MSIMICPGIPCSSGGASAAPVRSPFFDVALQHALDTLARRLGDLGPRVGRKVDGIVPDLPIYLLLVPPERRESTLRAILRVESARESTMGRIEDAYTEGPPRRRPIGVKVGVGARGDGWVWLGLGRGAMDGAAACMITRRM